MLVHQPTSKYPNYRYASTTLKCWVAREIIPRGADTEITAKETAVETGNSSNLNQYRAAPPAAGIQQLPRSAEVMSCDGVI